MLFKITAWSNQTLEFLEKHRVASSILTTSRELRENNFIKTNMEDKVDLKSGYYCKISNTPT